jgi:hypothetical protein
MAAEENHVYDFGDWDIEQFTHAGNVLASIARRDSAIRDARSAIMRLYFNDFPELEGDAA